MQRYGKIFLSLHVTKEIIAKRWKTATRMAY